MKMLSEWLETEAGIERQEGHLPYLTKRPNVREYLAQLISQNNGSMTVETVGDVQYNVGPYGIVGLTIQDALHLQDMGSFMNGVLWATDQNPKEAHDSIDSEIKRVEAEFQKALDSGLIEKDNSNVLPPEGTTEPSNSGASEITVSGIHSSSNAQ